MSRRSPLTGGRGSAGRGAGSGANLPLFVGQPVPVAWSADTLITASASIHTKGSWTELISSVSSNAAGLLVFVSGVQSSGNDSRALLDIGYGAAASEAVKIANIPIGGTAIPGVVPGMGLYVPIKVPSGTRISARMQALISSDTGNVMVAVCSGDINKVPATIDTIGADTANSRGVNMPTSDTYVAVTASTSQAYRALIPIQCFGASNAYAQDLSLYTLATGGAGSETVIGTSLISTTTGESIGSYGLPPVISGDFPAGTRIACKQSIGRNYRDVIVLGVPAP